MPDADETEALIEAGQNNTTIYGSATPRSNGSRSSEDVFHCHGLQAEQEETKKKAKNVLWLSIILCTAFMIAEIIGGIWAQSLAIVTDAAHLLTDLASMMISLFSIYIASRPRSQRMSFGWHRAEVVGAFLSVFMIWVMTGVLVFLAIERMISKNYEINGTIMAITAGLGVLVNLVQHNHGEGNAEPNINVRAAFIHVLGDLLQSVGVLVAALLILYNEDWAVADPICTLLFSVIVLFTTIYIIRDALVVLLEGRPSSIDFRSVLDSLEQIDGVRKVHDLRIWALSMNKIAISVHLEIDPETSDAQEILRATTTLLRTEFGVHESTVQIEGYQPDLCIQCIQPR
uniref:Solute carrier family 30 member 2 n=1 Tax=Panagrolaimus sp. JU765 TaxID=591449 RepID=A0AC34QL07_9BILA